MLDMQNVNDLSFVKNTRSIRACFLTTMWKTPELVKKDLYAKWVDIQVTANHKTAWKYQKEKSVLLLVNHYLPQNHRLFE